MTVTRPGASRGPTAGEKDDVPGVDPVFGPVSGSMPTAWQFLSVTWSKSMVLVAPGCAAAQVCHVARGGRALGAAPDERQRWYGSFRISNELTWDGTRSVRARSVWKAMSTGSFESHR
ncbi:hypothetical protein GCM10027456_39730 [Kineosporia babensis]